MSHEREVRRVQDFVLTPPRSEPRIDFAPYLRRMEQPDTRVILRGDDPDADEDVTDWFHRMLRAEAVHPATPIEETVDESFAAQGVAHPATEGLDVERLAEAIRRYKPDDLLHGYPQRLTWNRGDPLDAPAIAAEYARLSAEQPKDDRYRPLTTWKPTDGDT